MRTKVDSVFGDPDGRDERLDELSLVADEGEDRAVVIGVGVDVEQTRVHRQLVCDRIDRRPVATLAEVRDGLEQRARDYFRSVEGVLRQTGDRVRRLVPRRGRFAERDRPEWEAEVSHARLASSRRCRPARTLDVACGTGFLTRHLLGDVVALDQSERMLEQTAAQAPRATVVQGDALALPFPDATFDRVFTGHFYGHLRDDERLRFLAEAARVARELVVVDSARAQLSTPTRRSRNECSTTARAGRSTSAGSRVRASPTELGGGDVLHDGRWFVAVRSPV